MSLTAPDSWAGFLRGRKVLITGASGFVGRHVTRLATQAGAIVHALNRAPILPETVASSSCDLTDALRVAKIFRQERPDYVIHLAAAGVNHGSNALAQMLAVNCDGLLAVLEAASSCGTRPQIVCAGSGFEYAPQNAPLREDDPIVPQSAYGATKAAGFMIAQYFATQLPITWLRLFSIYGPGEREPRLAPHVIGCAQRRVPIELTEGEQVRDYTCVTDVAEGLLQTLLMAPKSPGLRVLNLASGRSVILREFVELLADVLRKRGLAPELRFGAKPYRSGELMHYTADIAHWREQMQWTPSVSLRDGLQLMVDLTA